MPTPENHAHKVDQPPTKAELGRIATDLGLDIAADQLAQYSMLIEQGLAGYSRLDELTSLAVPSSRHDRDPGYRPEPADNPCHGWVWRCSIKGAPDGPLTGKRVAVKDNISVAGVPMLNGSAMMRGFVPREDATVVCIPLTAPLPTHTSLHAAATTQPRSQHKQRHWPGRRRKLLGPMPTGI